MKRPVLVVLTTLAVFSSALVGGPPAAAVAAPADQLRESVLVTGRGEVSGEPDTLTANLAVETRATTVGQALDEANKAATRMRDTLARAGAELRTSHAGITATRDDKTQITNYTASQGLTATIRNLPQAGTLLSAAVAAGGDAARLNGVSFTIENDAALLAEARRRAFADARAKAEVYARQAGRPLGRVLTVSEAAPAHGWPIDQDRFAAADSAVPIEPGRQRLAVTVTVEWAFDPQPAQDPAQRADRKAAGIA